MSLEILSREWNDSGLLHRTDVRAGHHEVVDPEPSRAGESPAVNPTLIVNRADLDRVGPTDRQLRVAKHLGAVLPDANLPVAPAGRVELDHHFQAGSRSRLQTVNRNS